MKIRHPFVAFLLCAAAGSTAAAPAVEYLVIGNPAACELFDQYEQPLDASKKRALPKNMPFEIVNARRTMGDQITQGMRLSHSGTTWYLMLDEKGKITGLPPEAASVRYRGCTPADDTLVVALRSLPVYDRNPPGAAAGANFVKGDKVVRIFTCGASGFYCRPGPSPRYGWSNAPKNAFSIPNKAAVSSSSDGYAILHERIMKRLTDANVRYDTLFRFFNAATGRQKSVPYWEAVRDGTLYRYRLIGSVETVNQLETSTGIILQDIDYLLAGKPFTASFDHGVIIVGPRERLSE